MDRARAIRQDFVLTERNAAAVVELCRRLEGLPLAIELAAARVRLLDPDALLRRLARSMDALGAGAVDLPERQHTLRATVQWSVGLLEEHERSLLEAMAVFVDGWTVEAAAQVAGLDEDQTLDLTEALARHSLVQVHVAELDGEPGPRSRMLETIRAFVVERLAARSDAAQLRRRHADYYRMFAERTDLPLRGAGHGEWLDRLDAEAGNLAAAVGWYLAHDRGPLPHFFRVLWGFWFLRDHMGQACVWVGELLPAAGSLDPETRAELVWTALVAALEVGDDAAALSAREHLASLVAGIADPFLQAVSQLALAWTSPLVGDFAGAMRDASASLDQLRRQDEPFWTAMAVGSLGSAEMAVARNDDALSHLREARDQADRSDNTWLAAWSRGQLGVLAITRGRPEEAGPLLDEALRLSLAAHSTRSVSLCLAAFARLALVEGDAERAALLAGAAEGLRQRAGQQVWPTLRRERDELIAQVRQALGPERFDQVFAAGVQLNQRQALAAVHDRRGAGTQAP